MRVTDSMLESALRVLNSMSRRKYRIERAYGGYRLIVEIPDSDGAVADVSARMSKSELYYTIHAIIKYLEQEKLH